jgi:hypothetical protein
MGDIATDWAVGAEADPQVFIHSNTSPASDYLRIGNHTGTVADIDVVGGTTLQLQIAGNTEVSVTASGLTLPANSDLLFTGTTGTNDINLVDSVADALSIVRGSTDVIVFNTSTPLVTITPATTITGLITATGGINIGTVAAAGTDTDKFLVLDGSGNVDYRTGTQVLCDIGGGSGTGDFSGPGSSTDNAIVRFDGTGGKTGQTSGVTVDDSNNLTVPGTVTVGSDGSGTDVIFYSGTAGDNLTWDASEEVLNITGTDGATALDVKDGDVVVVDKIYLFDRGGEYISSNGSVLAITGATTVSSTLGVTGAITANAGVVVDNFTLDGTELDLSSGDFTLDVAGDVAINADGGDITFADASLALAGIHNSSCVGELRLHEAANYVGFKAPALSANQIWTLPAADGNACDVLTCNGSGVLSWAAAAGGPTEAAKADMENEGTSNANRYVSPEVAKYHPGAAKAWLFIEEVGNLGCPDYNVTCVDDTGPGNRFINFTVNFSTAVYSAQAHLMLCGDAAITQKFMNQAECGIRLKSHSNGGSTHQSGVLSDYDQSAVFFGDQ